MGALQPQPTREPPLSSREVESFAQGLENQIHTLDLHFEVWSLNLTNIAVNLLQ